MDEKPIRRLIVGTDFNELSTAALRFAGTMAQKAQASITVVYADIFEPQHEFTARETIVVAEMIERSKERTREQLERHAAHNVPPGVTFRTLVADGLPAPALSMTADTEHADLIVLGTHGRGGLQRLVIGSVAEAVIREAHVPVLTVRSTVNPESVRRILCPVNGTVMAAVAAHHAAVLAAALDAELALLHVSTAGDDKRFDPASLPASDDVKTTVLMRRTIAHEDAAGEILEIGDSGAYDLIVIGAEHKLVRDITIFGTTTSRVTRHARTPVLTVTRNAVRAEKVPVMEMARA